VHISGTRETSTLTLPSIYERGRERERRVRKWRGSRKRNLFLREKKKITASDSS
jgi:hypothetical protein